MTLITGIPGLIALLICIRRGPERALIDVYLPTLLLLPDTYHWMITGHLSFNETAIIPIAGLLIARSWRDWRWSFTDLLLVSYVAVSVISEYVNKDFAEARNFAIELICNSAFPYIVAKSIFPREDLYMDIAKRIVTCLTIVAIVNVYEFRMGKNPFDMVLMHFFPGQSSAIWAGRYSFLRTAGPYGHAIIAGIIFAIAYRLNYWIDRGGYWRTKLPYLPISRTRFCKLWLIAGSIMTLSRGPWLGAGIGALVVGLGRVRNRKQTIAMVTLAILFVGIPLFQATKSYVWVERDQATSQMEETAAYRHELIQKYMVIFEERPVWGWGRNNFPAVDGLTSVDNHYLLLALTSGEYALGLFVAILVWMMGRLTIFCIAHHGTAFPGSIALTFLGIYVTIVISIATVWLGAQTTQLLFLLSGWSEALVLVLALKSIVEVRGAARLPKSEIRRVMA